LYKDKLVGRAEHIHLQQKWRYGFSHYTTGRVGDFPVCGKASTEVRDRTVARTVPRSRMNMLSSGNGIPSNIVCLKVCSKV